MNTSIPNTTGPADKPSHSIPADPAARKNDPSAYAPSTAPVEVPKELIDTELALLKEIPGKDIAAVIRRIAERCRAATHMGSAFPTCLANALAAEAQYLAPRDSNLLTPDEAKAKVEALRHSIGAAVLVLDDTSASAAARAEALKKISDLKITA